MDMKKAVVFLAMILALPLVASAEITKDLRLKYGYHTPGLEETRSDSNLAAAQSRDWADRNGNGIQIEGIFTPVRNNPVSFAGGLGMFMRSHPGTRGNLGRTYHAKGVSTAAGLSLNPVQGAAPARVHVETKLGLDFGLADTQANGVSIDLGPYVSYSLTVGAYLTVKPSSARESNRGLQLGLEFGPQWWRCSNNYSTATASGTTTANGSDFLINLVGGIRF